ncbi:hypothetical protein QYE76_040597 [Lolium multiflorum]|uniref:DUF4218 domain-containing protein n=1 Tax=Lolium multiflorum TaxID=4521 RepID=A0AAD8TBV3_LOLMU|nr:hypothetical protein QYE76_040597 [Lolium multiflorum]
MDDHVRATLTGLCNFFDVITRKSISVKKLARLQEEIVVILCEMEMYFPPAFFDVMVHLLVHIMDDIVSLGPAFLHNMMPFERMNGVIKGYVRNRSHPDGSIVQGWLKECISFCTNYLDIEDPVGLPQNKHLCRFEGVGHREARHPHHLRRYRSVARPARIGRVTGSIAGVAGGVSASRSSGSSRFTVLTIAAARGFCDPTHVTASGTIVYINHIAIYIEMADARVTYGAACELKKRYTRSSASRVIQEIMSHQYSPPSTSSRDASRRVATPVPSTAAICVGSTRSVGYPAFVVYKIGGDPSDYQFLAEAPKEIPQGYACTYADYGSSSIDIAGIGATRDRPKFGSATREAQSLTGSAGWYTSAQNSIRLGSN